MGKMKKQPIRENWDSKTYYWCPNHGKEGQWVHCKPEECNVKPATTTNPQAANLVATDLLVPSSNKSTKHTLQCQVNVNSC